MSEYVPNTGGTMTGGLTLIGMAGLTHKPTTGIATVTAESTDATAYVEVRTPPGTSRGLLLCTSSANRWLIGTDGQPESVENNGSNLAIYRFADNGSPLGYALQINRANGLVSVAGPPTSALGVATKQYADDKVADTMAGSKTVAPSQDAVKRYVDSKTIVSDSPASGVLPAGTLWIEY